MRIFFILYFLIFYNVVAIGQQKLEVKHIITTIDTATNGNALSFVKLKVNNILNDQTHTFKILYSEALNTENKKMKFDSFYTVWPYETKDSIIEIAFDTGKVMRKIKSIKGKIRYFTPSNENGSVVTLNKVCSKKDSLIYKKKSLLIVSLDLKNLYDVKQNTPTEFNNYLNYLAEKHKLNKKSFNSAVKQILKNYVTGDDFIFYAQDPERILTSIDTSKNEQPLLGGTANLAGEAVKVFLTKLKPESVRVIIENEISTKDYEFETKMNCL